MGWPGLRGWQCAHKLPTCLWSPTAADGAGRQDVCVPDEDSWGTWHAAPCTWESLHQTQLPVTRDTGPSATISPPGYQDFQLCILMHFSFSFPDFKFQLNLWSREPGRQLASSLPMQTHTSHFSRLGPHLCSAWRGDLDRPEYSRGGQWRFEKRLWYKRCLPLFPNEA